MGTLRTLNLVNYNNITSELDNFKFCCPLIMTKIGDNDL